MDGRAQVTESDGIDQRVYDLYDEYCHGRIDRRTFLKQAAVVAGGLAMAQALMPRYADALGADLRAAVPYYGAAPVTAAVPDIKAPLLIQYAENDERINAMWPDYETALKAAGASYEMFTYPGTQHGFHNNSTPRYQEA